MNPEVYKRFMFRAWSKALKKMLTPYYIPTADPLTDATRILIRDPTQLSLPAGELIINQCTSLCDGNKNWIFEGDIVSVESHDALIFHLPVVFVHGSFGVLRGREFIPFLEIRNRLKVETIVIIGNVYENAELLNMRDPFLKNMKGSKPN